MAIQLLSIFLLIVAGYVGWWSITYAQLLWLPVAAVALIGSVGLFLHRRWAQYLWYVIALTASVLLLVTAVRIAISDWPYDDLVSFVISLAPGLLLLVVCISGSIAVTRHFRGPTDAL